MARQVLQLDSTGELELSPDVEHRNVLVQDGQLKVRNADGNQTHFNYPGTGPMGKSSSGNFIRGDTELTHDVRVGGDAELKKHARIHGNALVEGQLTVGGSKMNANGINSFVGNTIVSGELRTNERVCFKNKCTDATPTCRTVHSAHVHLGHHQHNYRTAEMMKHKPLDCANDEYMSSVAITQHPNDGKSQRLTAKCCKFPWA